MYFVRSRWWQHVSLNLNYPNIAHASRSLPALTGDLYCSGGTLGYLTQVWLGVGWFSPWVIIDSCNYVQLSRPLSENTN